MVVANDSACGSTIGPMMSAKLGVRTVDIGGPTLSMHSVREMCCTTSVHQCCTLFQVSSIYGIVQIKEILDVVWILGVVLTMYYLTLGQVVDNIWIMRFTFFLMHTLTSAIL